MKKGSYVPDDIVANILPRLPAKSLVRFKYLSRSWFSFISQLKFGNKKLVFSTLDYIKSLDLEAPNSNIKALPLESPDSKGYEIELIGSCNGLLCILQLEWEAPFCRGKIRDRVMVWNPLMSTHKTIQLPSPRPRNVGLNYRDQYGFGYDKSSDDYKILRILLCPFHSSCCDPPLLNIYSLKTDSWETKTFPWPFWFTSKTEAGTFMDGALYWDIYYLKLHSCDVFKRVTGASLVILSYDFIDENVSAIELPDNIGGEIHIREFGGRLCMFLYKHTKRIDIWAMEKKENNYNWIKWMCIPPLEEVIYWMCLTPLYFMKDCQVLVNILQGESRCFTEEFRLYSPKENFRKIKIEGIESSIFHREFLYQETLISPILLNLKNKTHFSQKQKAKTRSHSPLRQKAVTVSTLHCDRKPRIGGTTLTHTQNSLDQEVVATVPSSRQRKREGHDTVCCCFPWSL